MAKRTKQLRAGKGARATILTRFIKPKPTEIPSKDHRSEVILLDRFEDEKGKVCYQFRYAFGPTNPPDNLLLYANSRYIKVEEEGDFEQLFEDHGEGEDGKIKWADSEARSLLYDDILNGVVPLYKYHPGTKKEPTEPDEEGIYVSRPQYAAFDKEKFAARLAAIRKKIQDADSRADKDEKAFNLFRKNHNVSMFSHKGYIQWQGSQAQTYALADIRDGVHKQKGGYRKMYNSRSEYYTNFDFPIFSQKVRQEIKTGKWHHTLKVRGQHRKAS